VYWSDNLRIVRVWVRFPPQAMSLHKEEILLQTISNISQWFISIFKNVKWQTEEISNAFNLVICISRKLNVESQNFFNNLWSYMDNSWENMSLKIWFGVRGFFLLRKYVRLLQLWTLEGPIDLPNIRGEASFHVNSKWTSLLLVKRIAFWENLAINIFGVYRHFLVNLRIKEPGICLVKIDHITAKKDLKISP
jgi:hypothetical protein